MVWGNLIKDFRLEERHTLLDKRCYCWYYYWCTFRRYFAFFVYIFLTIELLSTFYSFYCLLLAVPFTKSFYNLHFCSIDSRISLTKNYVHQRKGYFILNQRIIHERRFFCVSWLSIIQAPIDS